MHFVDLSTGLSPGFIQGQARANAGVGLDRRLPATEDYKELVASRQVLIE
jgi:hypothetical protein